MIPEHRVYVEPFVGGGSIFFKKPLAEKSVINDKNTQLINFYKRFKNSNCKKLKNCRLPKNRKAFESAKTKTNASICNFLAINKRSYGCKMVNPSFNQKKSNGSSSAGIENIKKSCNRYKEKLKNTVMLNQDYGAVVRRYDTKDAFHYLDPPYVDTYDYGQKTVNPEDVCKLAKSVKGKIMISYNNHPRVRKACKGLHFRNVKTTYEMQKAQTGQNKEVKELIITNF